MISQERMFADRRQAGVELGKLLEDRYKDQNVLVLGIPRGGVLTAYEVARALNAELSVVITKKIPHPLQEELAIGATAEDGSVYLTALGSNFNDETINRLVKKQKLEIESRIRRFRKGRPLPDMTNRTVIIVDDGIATGSTIVPAIKLCRNRNAARIVVACPVSGQRYVPEIDDLADEVVIAEQPEVFFAVGQVYRDFHSLSDDEVIGLLDDYERMSGMLETRRTRT